MNRILILLVITAALAQSAVAAAGTVPGTTLKYEASLPVRTTGYVTGTCDTPNGDPQWCSPTAGECITSIDQMQNEFSYIDGSCTSQGKGWCCIREEDRGFYEEVLCQGSGVCQEQTFNSETITPTPGEEPIEEDYRRGITATGTEPTPKDTIAVNIQEQSSCYIPLGSKVYIDFGQGHPWNGQYTAEDIGAAFQGDGRAPNGNCKIDVYTGIDSASDPAKTVSRQDATAYIISTPSDKSVNDPGSQPVDQTIQQGFIEATYTYQNNLPVLNSFSEFKAGLDHDLNECATSDNPRRCAKNTIRNAQTPQWTAQTTCQPLQDTQPAPSDQSIIAQGVVTNSGSIATASGDTDRPNSRTITINESSGPKVITLLSDSISKLSVSSGETLRILGQPRTTQIKLNQVNLDLNGEIKTLQTQTDQIISYLTRLASCRTADQMCVCDIKNDLDVPITFDQGIAKTPKLTDEPQPYFFDLYDGSNIPTSITSALIRQNSLDFSLLKTQASLTSKAKTTVLPADKTTYFLKTNSKNIPTDLLPGGERVQISDNQIRLAKLKERPVWYKGQQKNQTYNNNLIEGLQRDPIATALSIQQAVTNPASHIAGDKTRVPSCTPKTVYQSVCVKKKPNVQTSPPMSVKPFTYIKKI
jgi:3D (Asp-Asp-Asp) domain-containing protein